MTDRKFKEGDRVTKTKGSEWTGCVVGFYSTALTPIGYAVESENEPGSVQIYPEAALAAAPEQKLSDGTAVLRVVSKSPSRDQSEGMRAEGEETVALHSEGTPDGGVIRLSRWPEGYVLWYHGQIVWRSWGNSRALLDVASERRRQVEQECWTPEHDDAHHDFSLAKAACIYAVGATLDAPDRAVMDNHGADGTPGWMKELWPWDIKWWKPTGRRRDLVKAGALIIAEIERLDRAAMNGGDHE